MASSWIEKRSASDGSRWRVKYRVGGRESPIKFGGSFRTQAEAKARQRWISGELAAMRTPDLQGLAAPTDSPTLREVAERWRSPRVDVAAGTAATHKVNLHRILPRLGERTLDTLKAADVAALVAELHADGLRRESIRKTISTFSQVLAFAKVEPNPAKDDSVRLPREDKAEINPPTAEHVLAVYRRLRERPANRPLVAGFALEGEGP
jgi:Phage integrase, N-terminal SAM-like domain